MELQKIVENEQAKIGSEIGVSNWITIDQDRIDAFADVTEDHQFIHVDPKAAAMGPFGGTIAHGFLSLSLLARMAMDTLELLPNQVMFINYGFEKIRFLTPVKSGAKVRARFTLKDVSLRDAGQMLHTYDLSVEIGGEAKPALIATWLSLAIFRA